MPFISDVWAKFWILRCWAAEEASARNVPRYRIAPDNRLLRIASAAPDLSAAAWAFISGRPGPRETF